MRTDLFQYLDILSSQESDHPYMVANRNRQIERIAARLKELVPFRAKALDAAIEAGRIVEPGRPAPPRMAEKAQKYWERAVS